MAAMKTNANVLPLRVFLVEDSRLFRERMAEQLAIPERIEIIGYADSETTAISALQFSLWDALILDLQLKQGNGMEVLKTLQIKGRPAGARIIVLTDHDYYLYRSRCLECGANHFFNKSSEFHLVMEVLEKIILERQVLLA